MVRGISHWSPLLFVLCYPRSTGHRFRDGEENPSACLTKEVRTTVPHSPAIQTQCNDGVTAAIVARGRRCGSSGTARPSVGGTARDGGGHLAREPAPADQSSRR